MTTNLITDIRKPENRMDVFLKLYKWKLDNNDIDEPGTALAFRDTDKSPTGEPMTVEQALWFSLLQGFCHEEIGAWAIYWRFPNFKDIDLKELEEFQTAYKYKLAWASDMKWKRGKAHLMAASIKETIAPFETLTDWINSFYDFNASLEDNYHRTYAELSKFLEFGRMANWVTQQALHTLTPYKMMPPNVLADRPENWSVRNGLLFLFNRPIAGGGKESQKRSSYDPEEVLALEEELVQRIEEAFGADFHPQYNKYTLETWLCEFKRLCYSGGEYMGYNTTYCYEWLCKMQELFPDVDYSAALEFMETNQHPKVRLCKSSHILQKLGVKTGRVLNLEDDYPEFGNLYQEFNLPTDFMRLSDKEQRKAIQPVFDFYVEEESK